MRALILALPLVAVGGCADITAQLAKLGIDPATVAMCGALVAAEIRNDDAAAADLSDRLREAGVACIKNVAVDVVTVQPVPATADAPAGTVVLAE